MELGDILTSLNKTKENLLAKDEKAEKSYVPFVINKCYSYHLDTLFQANFLNQMPFLDKKMQYEYYLNGITKKTRFCKWIKPQEIALEAIMGYYGYSRTRAMEVMDILSESQLEAIKKAMDRGGKH